MTRDSQRQYYLDHLRVALIAVVFFAHCSLPFSREASWHVTNAETSFIPTASIGFLYQWVLHLFFLICGASAAFSLRHRNAAQFIIERSLRLAVPYLAAVAILVPFQAYFEPAHYENFHGNLLDFYGQFYRDLRINWLLRFNMDTYHLWFLRFLFGYCALALPLFLFFKTERGDRWSAQAAAFLEKPGMLLLCVIPVAAVQVALRVRFYKHEGWANYICWLVFFVYGYLFATHNSIQQTVRKHGLAGLITGAMCFMLMGALFYAGRVEAWERTPSYSMGWVCYEGLSSLNTCCWVLFFLSMGMRFLDFRASWLPFASEGVLPFYILHQPIVVAIAFYVVRLHAGMLSKYVLISAASLAVTLILYGFLINRFNALRFLFGMHLKARALGRGPARVAALPAVATLPESE